MKIITILSGVILTLTGVFCVARSGATFAAIAFILGFTMLLHGIFSAASCATEKKYGFASGYVLADGAISLLLSAVVLADLLTAEAVVPVFFGMWLLFSGAMHAFQSLVTRGFGEKYWFLGLISGLLSMVIGMSAFVHPIVAGVPIAMLLGFYYIAQGISVVLLGLHFKNRKKRGGRAGADSSREERTA